MREFLESLGLNYQRLVLSMWGALVALLLQPTLNFRQALLTFLGGVACACLAPPFIHQKVWDYPMEFENLISFLGGLSGMLVVARLYEIIKGAIQDAKIPDKWASKPPVVDDTKRDG